MKNVHKTLTTAVAVILCVTFTASSQQPASTLTADTLPSRTISAPSRHSEPALSADSLQSLPLEQIAFQKLDTISRDVAGTRKNTDPQLRRNSWKTIAGISLVVAIFSGIFSYKNFKEQKETRRNTERLTLKEQQDILIDLIRHLYRNLVVTRTIETKMRALDFQAYPSEEHLVKLQIPLERIKLDSFLSTEFTTLSDLYLKFRNYNEEVLIIKDHFKDQDLKQEAKERDLETLTFKCGFLASKIYSFLTNNSPKRHKWNFKFGKTSIEIIITKQPRNNNSSNDIRLNIIRTIEQSHKKNVADNPGNAIAPEIEQKIKPYKDKKDLFMEIFNSEEQEKTFWEGLNRDIRIECGNKQKAEDMVAPDFKYKYTTDKIYMVKFSRQTKQNKQNKQTKQTKRMNKTVIE